MIASLTGRLSRKAADYLIIEVAGVGYQVQVPLSTYYGIPETGNDLTLYIHTHVREDALALFGFLTQAEKDMFLILTAVTGIGPKLALAVLSSLSVRDIASAIQSSDDSALCAIPGIGKKTAARMCLELRDRIKHLTTEDACREPMVDDRGDVEDAVSALVNLGYKKPLAEDALKRVRQGRPGLAIEDLIREALGFLIKR